MLWLIVITSSYFLAAITTLGDKYLLLGPPKPKVYSFYVGLLSGLALLLIPFIGFSVPAWPQLLLALFSGAVLILGQLTYFSGLEEFEASRIVPAIGGLLPLFVFVLVFVFFDQKMLSVLGLIAFVLLLAGSIFVSLERGKKITLRSFQIAALAAFFFALSFTLAKIVYLNQPFWSGFIWMRIGGLAVALNFLFYKEVRNELFGKKPTFQKKTGIIFVLNQGLGGGAFILQNWAIALVPLTFLPFINALEGMKYVFLLLLAILICSKFPKLLKEKISKEIILQKTLAILLLIIGLVILALV